MSPCETLGLNSFCNQNYMCSLVPVSGLLGACGVSGHEPRQLPCLKYTLWSSSVPTSFMLSEVMDVCTGVIFCKVIWEIGPQMTFLDIVHIFTLLPTTGTYSGDLVAQLCSPHFYLC